MQDIKRQRLFVLIGIPGAGKSTLAQQMIEQLGDDVVCVSKDFASLENGSIKYNRKDEAAVYKTYINKIVKSLRLGFDVIADDTNLTSNKRDIYFAICEALKKIDNIDIDVIGVFLSTPLSVCMERNDENIISNETIEIMHSKIEEPSYDEGFKIIMNKY